MDEEEEPEFIRADTWMQSMVPSLPKGCAIFCLICNVIVPGLGTFTGGVISCCYGRPRLEFRPARYRCPTAFMVMLVGVAQFLCTGFFLVGWLWSIIWGFLMLNLSDPKYRTLPSLPSPVGKRAITPIVKVDQPDEDVPTAKKNFGRLITKARENKDQALGLVPPPPPSNPLSDSSFGGSFLSHIPSIRCTDSKTSAADSREKSTKPRSESKRNLLDDSEPKSVKVISSLGPTLSAHRMFRRWKKAVISKVPKPGIACISGGGASSEVTLTSRRVSVLPPLPPLLPVTNGASDRKNGDFSEIISVTPATPIRSRPLSAIGSKTSPENIATVNPVVVHVAESSETPSVPSPNAVRVQQKQKSVGEVVGNEVEKDTWVPQVQPNMATEFGSTVESNGRKKVPSRPATKENLNPKTDGQKVEAKTTEQKVDTHQTTAKVDHSRSAPKVDSQKPGVKLDQPIDESGSKSYQTKLKLEPKTDPNRSESTTNKVIAKVGPLSARSTNNGLNLSPTELFQRQLMKPRTKQSTVYHYDV